MANLFYFIYLFIIFFHRTIFLSSSFRFDSVLLLLLLLFMRSAHCEYEWYHYACDALMLFFLDILFHWYQCWYCISIPLWKHYVFACAHFTRFSRNSVSCLDTLLERERDTHTSFDLLFFRHIFIRRHFSYFDTFLWCLFID